VEVGEVEGGKVCESMKKVTEERDCWNKYSERESETVGDEEELTV
jgi:hypothetical protein